MSACILERILILFRDSIHVILLVSWRFIALILVSIAHCPFIKKKKKLTVLEVLVLLMIFKTAYSYISSGSYLFDPEKSVSFLSLYWKLVTETNLPFDCENHSWKKLVDNLPFAARKLELETTQVQELWKFDSGSKEATRHASHVWTGITSKSRLVSEFLFSVHLIFTQLCYSSPISYGMYIKYLPIMPVYIFAQLDLINETWYEILFGIKKLFHDNSMIWNPFLWPTISWNGVGMETNFTQIKCYFPLSNVTFFPHLLARFQFFFIFIFTFLAWNLLVLS